VVRRGGLAPAAGAGVFVLHAGGWGSEKLGFGVGRLLGEVGKGTERVVSSGLGIWLGVGYAMMLYCTVRER